MQATYDAAAVSRHYDSEDLGARILTALEDAGKDVDRLTPAGLAPLDQFHIGGRAATIDLLELAQIAPGATVVDIGGGIGGPARTLATERDCRVTVLDLSRSFCEAGALLTERTGLSGEVTFRQGDALAMPFADGEFEVAWTQHSSMNIEDKVRLYREIRRVVRTGGKLAIHEIVAGPEPPVRYPTPWARDQAISFLCTAPELRETIAAAGFREIAWRDATDAAIAFWRERMAVPPSAPKPLGLHVLLGTEFAIMGANTSRNLEERRIEAIQAVFDAV